MARKLGKLSERELSIIKDSSTKSLYCKCGRLVWVDSATESVACWKCTTTSAPPEARLLKSREELQQESDNGYTKGWRLMKQFVHRDGVVYELGEEKPELKGTLEPTDIEALRNKRKKKRKTIREKNLEEEKKMEQLAEIHEEAKQEKKLVTLVPPVDGQDITTSHDKIVAEVTQGEDGKFKAIDVEGFDFTAMINNQPKLKYVFNNSKKVAGKRNEDGTYTWRGCK
jgi:hypothetical protein